MAIKITIQKVIIMIIKVVIDFNYSNFVKKNQCQDLELFKIMVTIVIINLMAIKKIKAIN